MRNKLLFGTALLAGFFTLAGAAHAVPAISLEILDLTSGTPVILLGPTTPVVGGSATATLLSPDANFASVTVTANGIPVIPSPNFASVTIDATSALAGAKLEVVATQVGATVANSSVELASTFTVNALTAGGITSIFANYISASDDAYAETTLIGTATMANVSTTATGGPFITPISVTGPFSETESYILSFTAGSQSALLTSAIVGVNVPEPATMALLGTGLLGLGLIRRRAH